MTIDDTISDSNEAESNSAMIQKGGLKGKFLAMAVIAVCVLGLTAAYFYRAHKNNRAEALRNLRVMVLGMHAYEACYACMPPRKRNGLSWRVLILPWMDAKEQSLFKRFNLDEPWDSPHNLKLVEEMPDFFSSPGMSLPKGHTLFQVPYSLEDAEPTSAAIYFKDKGDWGPNVRDVKDGMSNTVCVVEVDPQESVPWTKPDDWEFDASNPVGNLKKTRLGEIFVALADGTLMILPDNISPNDFKGIVSREGGEEFTLPRLKREEDPSF